MAADLGQSHLDHQNLINTVTRLRDEVDGLRQAMRSRGLIEQAKGMLMERYGCDADAAFGRLRRLSEHANLKLADVAAGLVESGTRSTQTWPAANTDVAPTPAKVQLAQQSSTAHWPRRAAVEDGFSHRLRTQSRRARLRMELLSAKSAQDVLSSVVRSALAERPPLAAALGGLDPNGVVRS
ncbi:MAG: ANTAR domain-containing response regulator, partial [Angustibacter sp.]